MQIHRTRTLDLTRDLPVHPRRNPSQATWKNLPSLRREFRQIVRMLVVDLVNLDVQTAARHALVRLPEIDQSLRCLGKHGVK